LLTLKKKQHSNNTTNNKNFSANGRSSESLDRFKMKNVAMNRLRNLPLEQGESEKVSVLPKGQDFLIYCKNKLNFSRPLRRKLVLGV
jgi:hypothetical protein